MRKIDQETLQTNTKNPFLMGMDLKARVSKRVVYDSDKSDEDSSYNASSLKVETSKLVDTGRCFKIYTDSKDFDDLLNSKPSGQAYSIIALIGSKLQWNQDLISISQDKYAKELEISVSSVAKALSELIDASVLIRYKRGYYWINPSIFFYGDRTIKYKDEVKVVE